MKKDRRLCRRILLLSVLIVLCLCLAGCGLGRSRVGLWRQEDPYMGTDGKPSDVYWTMEVKESGVLLFGPRTIDGTPANEDLLTESMLHEAEDGRFYVQTPLSGKQYYTYDARTDTLSTSSTKLVRIR